MADETDNPPFQPASGEADVAIQRAWEVHLEARSQISLKASAASMVLFAGHGQALPSLTVTSLIVPEGKTASGLLVKSTSAVWNSIVNALGMDWSLAYQMTPDQWEEIVAGAFKMDGYDEVTLTPRSGDYGRDVIAIKHGIGCVKVLGSVKAYAPGNNVPYDAVRALIGVITGEQNTSKGIITTTSDFPPLIESDINIAPFLPTRLELVNGAKLQKWLTDLSKT